MALKDLEHLGGIIFSFFNMALKDLEHFGAYWSLRYRPSEFGRQVGISDLVGSREAAVFVVIGKILGYYGLPN